MNKWADYLITGVRYNSDETFIALLEIRKDLGDKPDKPENYTRERIIDAIEKNITFVTSVLRKNDKNEDVWRKGADVSIIEIDNTKYLRSDRNLTKNDNLGSLPII